MVNTALNSNLLGEKEVTKAKKIFVKLICPNKTKKCPFGIACDILDAPQHCSLCGSKLEEISRTEH